MEHYLHAASFNTWTQLLFSGRDRIGRVFAQTQSPAVSDSGDATQPGVKLVNVLKTKKNDQKSNVGASMMSARNLAEVSL